MIFFVGLLPPVVASKDGMTIERPNYYVMRVSFIDMSSSQVKRFMKIVEKWDKLFLNRSKKWILYYIKLRIEATTLGEENVNIAGGTKEGYEIKAASKWLEKWGFEIFGNISMGPLLRSTAVGNVKLITHMPLASGSL